MFRFAVTFLMGFVCIQAFSQTLPVRIGVVGSFSDRNSTEEAVSMRGSARVFADEVNRMGGILGRKIEIVERDDQAKAETGVSVVKELVEKEKVVAVVGLSSSTVIGRIVPICQASHIPLLISGYSGGSFSQVRGTEKDGTNFVFRVAGPSRLQAQSMVRDIVERRGINALAVLYGKSESGLDGRDEIVAELGRRGIKPAAVEVIDSGDQVVSAALGKAREAGAKALLIYGGATESAATVRALSRLKWNVQIVGSESVSQQSFFDLAGPAADGVRAAVTFIEDPTRGTTHEFASAFRKLNRLDEIPAPLVAAQTYDALRLFYLAAFESGSVLGDGIQHTLEGLDIQPRTTVVTRYTRPFVHDDHEAVGGNMVVIGEVRNRRLVYAYPEEQAIVAARVRR